MKQNETHGQSTDQPRLLRKQIFMKPFLLSGVDIGRRTLKFLIPILVLLFLYTQTRFFIQAIKPAVALHLLKRLHLVDHLVLIVVCLFAITTMTAYDLLLLKWNRVKLPPMSMWKISWIANTFNNAMGFGGFTGAGLRLTLYRRRGYEGPNWLRSIVYLSLSGLTGLSLLALLLLIGVWTDHGMLRGHPWLLIAELAITSYAILFSLLGKLPLLRKVLGLTDKSDIKATFTLSSIVASFVEWFAAAFAFWTVACLLHLPIGFRESTGVYTMAAIAGVASFVPGGLGSFDAVALLGLHTFGVSPDQALATILLFRVFYYFIPWCIGLSLASTEWMPGKDKWKHAQQQMFNPVVRRWLMLWNWPSQTAVLRDISNWALAALVFIGGLLLLISAATPGQWHRIHALQHYVTPLTMKGSHQLTVLTGVLMLVVSEGIRLRIKRAYYFTLLLLVSGSVFSILKGFDYEEALFLIFIFLLLWMSKDRFNREETIFTIRQTVIWAGITLIVSLLYLSVGHLANQPLSKTHAHAKWIARFTLKDQEFRRESALALAASWLLLSMRWLLRPRRPPIPYPDHREWVKLQDFLARYDGNYLTHLVFLGDKSLMWSPDDQAVLAYSRNGKLLVSLGDPIGEPDSIRELVRQFRDYADRYACTPAFYQIKAEFLPLYHEFGLRFFKTGEEAIVRLDQFHLTGRRKADLRAAFNRYERNGFTFEIAVPPFSPLLILEIREVSDEWLGDRMEKGFSLGMFKETYLQLAPVALLRDRENRLAAFASMMPVYDKGKTISVDLMRHRRELNGVMDALLVHLLQWAKEQGYQQFNLGMAPLGRVGEFVYSFPGERIARWVFLKGNHFYGFQGIRRFKEKFDPLWEPRYLAYPSNALLPKVIFQLTRIISRRSERGKRKFYGM